MATLNKEALAVEIGLHEIFGNISKTKTKEFIEDFFDTIATQVAEGNTVSIAGFGKFTPFTRTNGETVPKFYAFQAFKDRLSN